MASTYSDKNITNMSQMQLMRFRPEFAIGNDDVGGQVHAIGEIISNSKDELPYVTNGSIELTVFVNSKEKRYQIAVSDSGRGVPLNSVVGVFTVPHTSAKYDQNAYNSSSGLFGIGAKATLAVTKRFRAISARNKDFSSGKNDLGYASVTTSELNVIEDTKLTGPEYENIQEHGVVVVFEFDPAIMTGMDDFYSGDGVQRVVDIMQKWHLFMPNCRFTITIVDSFLDESFWTADIVPALMTYKKCKESGTSLYDSIEWEDPLKYLCMNWDITGAIAWDVSDITHKQEDNKLSYQLMMFLPKRISNGGIIAFVNDVPISRADSSHVSSLYKVLKKQLSKFIEDNAIKAFFMERYKVPIYAALNVRYSGAKFVGATKESFRNAAFQTLFEAALEASFKEHSEAIEGLYLALADHIRIEYNKAFNKPIEAKSEQKLMLQLNHPMSYSDCTVYGPDSELFIVEGTSASGASEYLAPNQAMYATRGKPLNGITGRSVTRADTIRKLMKDKIWQDLIRIIGIQPGNDDQDLRTLRFGKIVIMHDADADGAHIETIFISNFHALNPRIVSEQHLWVAKPPLFLIQRKQSTKHKFFMFDEPAIMDCRALMYNHIFSIALREKGSKQIKVLDDDEFRSFCYVVLSIGEKMRDIADRLSIPDFILECLLHCLPWLDPNRAGGVCLPVLRKILPFDKIYYDRGVNALVVSSGMNDYTVTLAGFLKEVYSNLYPNLKEIEWDTYDILVSTKYTDEMKDELASFIKIYKLFRSVDNIFETERFKGLGTMRPDDLAMTCLVPDTRALMHIDTVGDENVLYDIMGTDTTARRELLSQQNLIG